MVYTGRDAVTGRSRYLSRTFHGGKRAAESALAGLVADAERRGLGGTRASVGWLLEQWLAVQEQEGKAPTTLRTYRGFVERWIVPSLGTTRLDRLTTGDVRALFARMTRAGLSASSARQVRAILSGALDFAVEHEWATRNVAKAARPPALRPPAPEPPTPEEARALLEAAVDEQLALATAVALATLTGARLGELCGLRWSDLELVPGAGAAVRIARSVYVLPRQPPAEKDTKTHAGRLVALGPLGEELVARRQAAQRRCATDVGCRMVEDPYFLSLRSDGAGPPSPHAYTSAFGRLRDRLGMRHVHLHSFRHYAATQLIGAGVDARTVAGRLGHSTPSVTFNVYAHAIPELDRRAAGVLEETLRTGPG